MPIVMGPPRSREGLPQVRCRSRIPRSWLISRPGQGISLCILNVLFDGIRDLFPQQRRCNEPDCKNPRQYKPPHMRAGQTPSASIVDLALVVSQENWMFRQVFWGMLKYVPIQLTAVTIDVPVGIIPPVPAAKIQCKSLEVDHG